MYAIEYKLRCRVVVCMRHVFSNVFCFPSTSLLSHRHRLFGCLPSSLYASIPLFDCCPFVVYAWQYGIYCYTVVVATSLFRYRSRSAYIGWVCVLCMLSSRSCTHIIRRSHNHCIHRYTPFYNRWRKKRQEVHTFCCFLLHTNYIDSLRNSMWSNTVHIMHVQSKCQYAQSCSGEAKEMLFVDCLWTETKLRWNYRFQFRT